MVKGLIASIQRFSLQDGPGIRSTLFFKGCPLECRWCSNPETQGLRPEIMLTRPCFTPRCAECVAACPRGAMTRLKDRILVNKAECTLCGSCVRQCPEARLTVIGTEADAGQVIEELLRDEPFYRRSGGGVTLSGGEPLAQPAFCREVLKDLKAQAIHTVLDTSGAVPWESLEATISLTDLFYFDLKHVDDERHRRQTGSGTGLILANLERLARLAPGKITLRIPIVPGFNTDARSIAAISGFIRALGIPVPVHLLPYHRLGQVKYSLLGRPYPFGCPRPLRQGEIKAIATAYSENVTVTAVVT